MKKIVDTNVPLVANGKSSMSYDCACRCIDFLKMLMDTGTLVIDSNYEIIKEYLKKLPSGGEEMVGDAFLDWVQTNLHNNNLVEMQAITSTKDKDCWYEEIPENIGLETSDRSDRKFIALAFAHPEHPDIVNASDTDWLKIENILNENSFNIQNLCGEELCRIFEKRN